MTLQPTPPAAKRRLTNSEKQMIFHIVDDYVLFGIPAVKIHKIICERFGRNVSIDMIQNMKREIEKNKDGDIWLDDFAKTRLADFYRDRIDRVEYLEKKLLTLFDTEYESKTPNKKLLTSLAHVIIEADKTLTEYGQNPVIISKIKELIPLDVTDYKPLEQRATNLIKRIADNNDIVREDTTGETETAEDDNAVF